MSTFLNLPDYVPVWGWLAVYAVLAVLAIVRIITSERTVETMRTTVAAYRVSPDTLAAMQITLDLFAASLRGRRE